MAKNKGVTAGELRDFRWGGLSLSPAMGTEAEYKLSIREYEIKVAGNRDTYAESESVVPYIQQDCVMTADEYEDFIALQDGTSRAGTATLISGKVLSLNCAIDGEHNSANGIVTVKLSGEVTVQ
jgi:hypothetical protein